MKQVNTITLPDLAALALERPARIVRNWWLGRAEQHYLMCADIEHQRAREAHMNVAYYQKRAAMARSERVSA